MIKVILALMLLLISPAQAQRVEWGGLIVEEEDGSPSVAGVWKIKVTNGQLTDEGSGVVLISVGTTAADALLMETADYVLMETSDKILLE